MLEKSHLRDTKEQTDQQPSRSKKTWGIRTLLQDRAGPLEPFILPLVKPFSGPHTPDRITDLTGTILQNRLEIQKLMDNIEPQLQTYSPGTSKFLMMKKDEARPTGESSAPADRPQTGPEYERLKHIRSWLGEEKYTEIQENAQSGVNSYKRFAATREQRKARKQNRPVRRDAENKLTEEKQYSQDVLSMLQRKPPLVDAIKLYAGILNPAKGKKSIVFVDLHDTLLTKQQDGSFVLAPEIVDTIRESRELGIEVVPITGGLWSRVRQELENNGPEGQYVLTHGVIYTSYGDEVWRGSKQSGGLRDSRLEGYTEEVIAIQKAIQERIDENKVLRKYVGIKIEGISIIDVRPKLLSGSAWAPNLFNLSDPSLKELSINNKDKEMALIDRKMGKIIKKVLKDHPRFKIGRTAYNGYEFTLKDERVLAELRAKDLDASNLYITTKAGAVDHACRELEVTGGALGFGDQTPDAPIAEELSRRKKAGALSDSAFIGTKFEGKIVTKIRSCSTSITDDPEETAEILKAIVTEIAAMRGIVRNTSQGVASQKDDMPIMPVTV